MPVLAGSKIRAGDFSGKTAGQKLRALDTAAGSIRKALKASEK